MQPFTLPSFAKINLGLRVAGKRDDGFHDLFTVFQTVTLADRITFEEADEIVLSCSDPRVPVDGSNLIVKAAEALQGRFGTEKGAKVFLEKNIPSPGGLGGGSSNAAVALLGLCRLWEIKADVEKLLPIAGQLGSDVPYFLYGGTATGMGRGTEIEPIDEFECDSLVIVTPDISVSTRDAFAGLGAASLTKDESNRILLNYRFEAVNADFRTAELVNDFEKTVFAAYPEITAVKQKLLELGARTASLSGSGASVFGIFDKQETRQTAMKALGNVSNWRSFAVATVSRDQYRGALGWVP
ncbi:MAG: 4-(cytidine 5'-diphospho)-2-C-methyl-D-erythritol kinase [Pyrinomonadaceae bacterium]|nr:4-(cytidine 5'-diphospho)-2-C-methyl-D-erythritol kinase [Pyrinomonadaceae bacterium]